jgi:Cu-processing system ATP-binding protein
MLDEPTVGLDPVATADLYQLLRTLRDGGTGIVLCSHVLPGVEPYIDRAAILTDGALKATGDLETLRRQANMPVTLMLEPTGSLGSLENAIRQCKSATSPVIKAANNRLQVDVRPADKMPLLTALMASGEVADVGIHQPTLEDIYVHFIGSGGLAHRGGVQ